MNQQTKFIVSGLLGLLMFFMGAGLRLRSAVLSTHPLPASMVSADNAIRSMTDDAQMQAINDVALVLLWAGAALVVVSVGAWVIRPAAVVHS